MMRRLGLLLLLVVVCAQAMAVEAILSHNIFYVADKAKPGNWVPNVETYWQINQATLHYATNADKKIVARIKTDILFTNDSGILLEDHYVLQTVPRSNVEELRSHSVIELRKYAMEPGFVKMRLSLTDMNDSLHHFTVTDTFTIPPVVAVPFYSSLQLLDTTIATDGATPFRKNGKQQIPACLNFMDEYKHDLHYYAEIYGFDKVAANDLPLVQKVVLAKNAEDEGIPGFMKKDTIKGGAVIPVAGTFPISSLPSGNYYVKATLETKTHVVVASQLLFFQRLNKHPVLPPHDSTVKSTPVTDTALENVTVLNLKKTFVAKYSVPEIMAIMKMILPFSDQTGAQTIRGFLKKPDELYMRYFVYNYFANINRKDPGRAFKEFSTKIIEVNKLYTSRGKPGYETDRGVIYLKYGRPNDVVTVENESGSLPYEVWQYNVLTQLNHKDITDAFFLFYKPNVSISDFRLLHSSVDGETINPDWRSYLYTGGAGTESRAEQMIGTR